MLRARLRLWLGVGGALMSLAAIGMAGQHAPLYQTVGLAFFGFLCLVLVLFLIPAQNQGNIDGGGAYMLHDNCGCKSNKGEEKTK